MSILKNNESIMETKIRYKIDNLFYKQKIKLKKYYRINQYFCLFSKKIYY